MVSSAKSSRFTIMDDDEECQLLKDSNITTDPSSSPILKPRVIRAFTWTRVYILFLHILLLATASAWWSSSRAVLTQIPTQGRTWSPVQEFIRYEINGENNLDHNKHSKLSGPPTAEQEDAWDRLMKPVYFRASREELEKGGETWNDSAELIEGGYLATLGVYHELHCLRQIRLHLYKERYYPNLTDAEEGYLRVHLGQYYVYHCLESLRLTIMCHGNTALYSFIWADLKADNPVSKSASKSVCVQWSSVEGWSSSRMVSPVKSLRRPSEG
ncbi:hypothetical protein B0T22DRAFT_496730 [Podospora appendiculata]|uniref:Uncharacterized protein n=1 Tax=Podospora appendiculata TaxID=314037 RepID=A0AAE0XIY3_9PEZI|nr:hypothetical protein B0T22DRAFT_496730 [Podospora appendiculata]